ncbi:MULTISPECIES: hypothetical protein [Protofrankia]|nr:MULTISPECIES: hypothetical protein [Protofrankia]
MAERAADGPPLPVALLVALLVEMLRMVTSELATLGDGAGSWLSGVRQK